MTTKLTSALPKSTSSNGLAEASKELVRQPSRVRVIVGMIDVKKVTHDLDTETDDPTVRIVRVELLEGRDAEVAERLLARAWERRTGQTVLPLDLEDDLRGVRSVRVDTATGEVLE